MPGYDVTCNHIVYVSVSLYCVRRISILKAIAPDLESILFWTLISKKKSIH